MKPSIDIIRNKCTGCYGCFNACAERAIKMVLNNEGFVEPVVNRSVCKECGRCQEHCPMIKVRYPEQRLEMPKVFAAWSNDDEIRVQSSSGGVFMEIASFILKKGGVVFGASFDYSSFTVKHILVDNFEKLKTLRGSKYVQSHVNDAYQKVIHIAEKSKPVLFSGTPCQVAALNTFLAKVTADVKSKIFTCEVICHGIASEIVFKSYLQYISNNFKHSKIVGISFRDKSISWKEYGMKITFSNGEVYFRPYWKDPFMIGYLRNMYLRQVCYECPFAKIPRVSDITLGDFWGVPEELNDPRGVSVVIVNTIKGERLLDRISNIEKVPISIEQVSPYNPRIVSGYLRINPDRNKFYELLRSQGFQAAARKYLKPTSKYQKVMLKAKFMIGKILNKFAKF